jgi:small basic protein
MIDLLVYLAILVIVICLVWWLLTQLPIPEEARKFINIAVVVVVAIVVIMLLLRLGGGGVDLPRLR